MVGELSYQETLERIAGGRTEESAHVRVEAELVLEPRNPFDPDAVRIDVKGETVGYLSRTNAKLFRGALSDVLEAGDIIRCDAVIRGGWDRGADDRGYFGIWLDALSTSD